MLFVLTRLPFLTCAFTVVTTQYNRPTDQLQYTEVAPYIHPHWNEIGKLTRRLHNEWASMITYAVLPTLGLHVIILLHVTQGRAFFPDALIIKLYPSFLPNEDVIF